MNFTEQSWTNMQYWIEQILNNKRDRATDTIQDIAGHNYSFVAYKIDNIIKVDIIYLG